MVRIFVSDTYVDHEVIHRVEFGTDETCRDAVCCLIIVLELLHPIDADVTRSQCSRIDKIVRPIEIVYHRIDAAEIIVEASGAVTSLLVLVCRSEYDLIAFAELIFR